MPNAALLNGSSIAATSWITDQPHLRVYTQDFEGGIRESRSDEKNKWTGGTSKDVIAKAKPYSPIAVVNVDNGAKIHVFYLNPENYIQEIIRDASSGKWSHGPLNHRMYKAAPVSRLSAFGKSRYDQLSVQYQLENGTLQEVSYQDESVDWVTTWSGGNDQPLLGTGLASFTIPTKEEPGARVLYQLPDETFSESGFEGGPGSWFNRPTNINSAPPPAHATNIAVAVSSGSGQPLAYRFHFIGKDNTPTEWGFYGGQWHGPNHPGHTKATPGSGIATVRGSNEDEWKLYIQQGSQIQEYFFKAGEMKDWEKGAIVPTGEIE